MTTYSMDSLINSVLHNGLFQRALFYNKPMRGTISNLPEEAVPHLFQARPRRTAVTQSFATIPTGSVTRLQLMSPA